MFVLISTRRFRWAALVQKRFSECLAPKKLEKALDELPKSLEAMYADVLMNKIPEDYREEAKVMLMWLAYSYRPLKLRELAVVASLPEQNVLLICTSSLVSLEGDVVRFDHFSVKEFLVSERYLASYAPTAASFYVPPMLAHLQIAGTCVSTLLDPRLLNLIKRYIPPEPDLHPNFHRKWSELNKGEDGFFTIIPLLEYSQEWYLHVQEADSMSARSAQLDDQSLTFESENLRAHIHKFFHDENHLLFKYWAQGVRNRNVTYDTLLSTVSPLHYTSYLNLPDSVRRLLKPRSNPEEAMGIVSTLRDEPQGRMTPLHIAGIRGNLEIVSLLLDSGMRIAQSNFEDMLKFNRRDGVAVMTSILKAQPGLSITDNTAIAAASNLGTKDFVEYFLNNGFLSSKARILLVSSHWQDNFHKAKPGLIKALVKLGESLGCTGQDFFNAIVQGRNFLFVDDSLPEFVLESYEPLSLSQGILECIASDTPGGVAMLRCLCHKYKGISFSQDHLAAAAEKTNGMDLVDIILEYDKSLEISQLVLQAAARCKSGKRVFFTLMKHNKSLEITWEILKAIVHEQEMFRGQEYQHQNSALIVKMIMDHEYCGFRLPDKEKLNEEASLQMYEHIMFSQDCKLYCSEQMLQAAARWEPDAIHYLRSHARPYVTFTKYALQEKYAVRSLNPF